MKRLELIDIKAETLDALIITHEHIDHIRGAGPLARRLDIPVYTNSSTLRRGIRALGNLSKPMTLHTGQTITINDLSIETFTKCHDAADPMGLILSSDGVSLGIATDLGRSTRLVEDRLRGSQALVIEFNHDQGMLEDGPYPWELKRRVKGPEGHLSNHQAGDLLRAVAHKDLRLVVLAHISQINNHAQKAFQEAKDTLTGCGLAHTRVLISNQDCPVPMVKLC
jgi:phosphoribosyl 1,2-cyclic phosphodiesterase